MKNKKIVFTEHALERLNFRKIDTKLVLGVIEKPEQVLPDEDSNIREIYQSVISNDKNKLKLLRVVIEETNVELLVISVYLTSKINKYWRQDNEI